MTISKISCRNCKHFKEGRVGNNERIRTCILKQAWMNGVQANGNKAQTVRGKPNPEYCADWVQTAL